MPRKKRQELPNSQAQARLLGTIAGSKVKDLRGQAATAYSKGLTKGVARSILRGKELKTLPPRKSVKKR
jgi:hypothetical protein